MAVDDREDDTPDGDARYPSPPSLDEVESAASRAALRRRLFGIEDQGARLGRFRLVRRLGAGSTGVVYEAIDDTKGGRVALKRLAHEDPELYVRLKGESRTLLAIAHPNLVQLYELFDTEQGTYFTMELVDGLPLDAAFVSEAGLPTSEGVRAAFSQLASALAHVHGAGLLHLDVKPSNVLRCADGRVVLLDFGLARTHAAHPLHETGHASAGTPLYMAPEQIDGEHVGPPADWYAFGTLLYQILCGRPPFDAADVPALRRAKRRGRPPPPWEIAPGVPRDLADLALALLAIDPGERPDGVAVTAALGGDTSTPSDSGIFVGRVRELDALDHALARARAGELPLARVVGGSGMGKSALLQRFGAEAKARDNAIVLAGRCHELESVPFRGLDQVVDDLSNFLCRMPDSRAAELLPRDVGPVTSLFPALDRVRVIAAAPRPARRPVDASELRRQAFDGLREMLARLADRQPVIALVDDWQWADQDAVELLHALVSAPDPPRVLFVLASREHGELDQGVAGSALEVGPLDVDEARDLVQRVGGLSASADARVSEVLRESDGCPLFLVELARSRDDTRRTMASHVAHRLEELTEDARRIVRTLALAGRPVPMSVVLEASGVAREREQTVVAALRGARLASTSSTDPDRLEASHDRIREIVASSCPAEIARELHRGLAISLGRGGAPDHAGAAYHFDAAGDRDRAVEHAEKAAARAAAGLAFEHAARWYRAALRWGEHDPGHVRDLLERLGDVLADAGRGAEAADAFIDASDLAPPAMSLELRRRAAGQLLRCGHIDRGRALLESVLHEVDLDIPKRPIVAMVVERLRLRLRLSKPRIRDESEIPPRELARIDACWSAATGFGFVDISTAAAFFALGTRLALEAGEATRVSRWLALHAIQIGMGGGFARRRAQAALERARAAVAADGQSMGLLRWAEGYFAHSLGQWRASLRALDEAVDLLQREARGAWWEMAGAQIVAGSTLYWLGDLVELRDRVEREVASAQARGDLFGIVTRRIGGLSAIGRLAADDPDRAEADVDEALSRWTRGVHVQHWYALQARVQIGLYRDEAETFWPRFEREWSAIARTRLLHVQPLRITTAWRRGTVALAASRGDGSLLRVVDQEIRRLRREAMPWADALASLLAAGHAYRVGDGDRAAQGLRDAIARCTATDMALLATVARRRLGTLVQGDEGAELVREADAGLRARGVRRLEPFCAPILPWVRGRPPT